MAGREATDRFMLGCIRRSSPISATCSSALFALPASRRSLDLLAAAIAVRPDPSK
ncbi:hypothetical protein GY45DRAFT_1328669 [Cubamyces sp. BRFM 1775]|nr:hypothetical protein GY45DRAFT_1328669 [Cubamyces sp. BRFM 1775]